MTRRINGTHGHGVNRNAHPRLRLTHGTTAGNPYDALRRAREAGRSADPRLGYRRLVRRLWQAA